MTVKKPPPEHLDMVFVLGRYALEFVPSSQLVSVLIVALDAMQALEKIGIFDKVDPVVVVAAVTDVSEQVTEGITHFEP